MSTLQISPEALTKLEELHQTEGGEHSAIRIAVMGGGSRGPGLGLIVDEPNADDIRFTDFTVPIIVDRSLMNYCKQISIEFQVGTDGRCGGASGSGFLIAAQNPINL